MVSLKVKHLEDVIEARIDWDNFNPDNPNYDKFMKMIQTHFHEVYKGNGVARIALFKNETIKWFEKENLQLSNNLQLVEDWRFLTVGQYYWLLNKGVILSKESREWVSKKMSEIEAIANKLSKENIEKNPILSKREPTPEKIGKWLADDLEELILTDDFEKNADTAYDLLRENNPKPIVMRCCIEHLKFLVREHHEYTKEEIKEGFGSKEKWSYYLEQYSSLLRLAETYFQNAKTVRKSRKPQKTKIGRAKISENVSFNKQDNKLKLVSVDPVHVIGSSATLIYNTKTRKIGVYYAKDDKGLQVRGTTIYNYNEDKSIHKTLRNPKRQIEGFRNKAIKRCKIILRDYIKAVAKKMNGRLNEHTIIMKTWK